MSKRDKYRLTDTDDMQVVFPASDGPPPRRRRLPDRALVIQPGGSMNYDDISLSAVGIQLPDDLSIDDYLRLSMAVVQVESSVQWWLGDLLAFGLRKSDQDFAWGETYQQVAAATGQDVNTLYTLAWVSRSVEFSLRKENLSYSHHKEIAKLEPDAQAYWLEQAAQNGWSVRALRDAIRPPALPAGVDAITQKWQRNRRKMLEDAQKIAHEHGAGQARSLIQAEIKALQEMLDYIE